MSSRASIKGRHAGTAAGVPLPVLPRGHKANVAWTSRGRRLLGTCWVAQLPSFVTRRILPGSTDIVVRCAGRTYQLGDKPTDQEVQP